MLGPEHLISYGAMQGYVKAPAQPLLGMDRIPVAGGVVGVPAAHAEQVGVLVIHHGDEAVAQQIVRHCSRPPKSAGG